MIWSMWCNHHSKFSSYQVTFIISVVGTWSSLSNFQYRLQYSELQSPWSPARVSACLPFFKKKGGGLVVTPPNEVVQTPVPSSSPWTHVGKSFVHKWSFWSIIMSTLKSYCLLEYEPGSHLPRGRIFSSIHQWLEKSKHFMDESFSAYISPLCRMIRGTPPSPLCSVQCPGL